MSPVACRQMWLRLRHVKSEQTQKEESGNSEKVRQAAIISLVAQFVEIGIAVDRCPVGIAGTLDPLPELPGYH